MKKSFKIIVSLLILSILLVTGAFAEGYHVCVASYQKLSNAQEMVAKLEKQSISAVISESTVKNKSYYRVLLNKEFKKIEDARKYRDEVKKYSFVKELGLKDFWVCKSEKVVTKKTNPAPVPVPAPAPKVVEKPKPVPAPKTVEKKVEPISEPEVLNIEPEPEPEPLPEPLPEPAPLPEPEPEPEPLPPPPVVEEVIPEPEPILLEKKEVVLSEETPFSVAVRSYKYEQFAENDKNRLVELGFKSYLVNTFDDSTFFSFNVHAGAFATKEEAEELQKQFSDAGITDTEISDFKDLSEKIARYEEIITNENVSFYNGREDIPTVLPETIKKLINEIPVNKNFPVEEISILDFDTYRVSENKPEGLEKLLDATNGEESIHSAALAKYYDKLYKKNVDIFIAEADSFNFDVSNFSILEHLQLNSTNGTFECDLYDNAGQFVLCGENSSQKLYIKIESSDFTQEEYVEFLNNSFNDSTLAIYPQLRRTLFVLPDENYNIERTFISFSLSKVPASYASERENKGWAFLIVDHYLAKTFMQVTNSLLSFGFYDLDYGYNAKSIHAVFTADKNNTSISGDNQPIRIHDELDGWYLMNSTQKEVSFSTKSYVIALDTAASSALTRDDLVANANDLKIWKSSTAKESEVVDAK